jgi:hypothetical protein
MKRWMKKIKMPKKTVIKILVWKMKVNNESSKEYYKILYKIFI